MASFHIPSSKELLFIASLFLSWHQQPVLMVTQVTGLLFYSLPFLFFFPWKCICGLNTQDLVKRHHTKYVARCCPWSLGRRTPAGRAPASHIHPNYWGHFEGQEAKGAIASTVLLPPWAWCQHLPPRGQRSTHGLPPLGPGGQGLAGPGWRPIRPFFLPGILALLLRLRRSPAHPTPFPGFPFS